MSETLINGDTAYMLICMALVNLMTPGLAFFYGGLVRSSNVLSIMAQNYASMGLMTIIWTAWGYVFLLSFLLLSCEDDDASLLSPRDYGVATNDAKTTVADIFLLLLLLLLLLLIVFEKTGIRYVSENPKAISSATRNRIIS